ncbi:hypothetical protein J0910_14280 [Nocardiopsis sp. CNT-189]|uniref:hypothetical protein n=1 Tax=Nocardiopsis oceanisediminis TaxID=2816862 RepID=UPI003B359A0D
MRQSGRGEAGFAGVMEASQVADTGEVQQIGEGLGGVVGRVEVVARPAGSQAGGRIAWERLRAGTRAADLLLRTMRGLGERAMALLVGRWRLLRRTAKSPSRIGDPVKAALVLHGLQKQTRGARGCIRARLIWILGSLAACRWWNGW